MPDPARPEGHEAENPTLVTAADYETWIRPRIAELEAECDEAMSEKCAAMNPRASEPDAWARCIHAAGHRGRHEDTYGRWWGKVESDPARPEGHETPCDYMKVPCPALAEARSRIAELEADRDEYENARDDALRELEAAEVRYEALRASIHSRIERAQAAEARCDDMKRVVRQENARLVRAEARCDEMREALDRIYAEPEDALTVQADLEAENVRLDETAQHWLEVSQAAEREADAMEVKAQELQDAISRAQAAEARCARMRKALIEARDALHRLCLERGSTDGYGATFERINAADSEKETP